MKTPATVFIKLVSPGMNEDVDAAGTVEVPRCNAVRWPDTMSINACSLTISSFLAAMFDRNSATFSLLQGMEFSVC